MNLTDGIDIAADLLPRKAKHVVAVAIVITALLCPAALSRVITWYANEKSHELVRVIERSFPTPAPMLHQLHPVTPADRQLGRAGS